MQHTQTACILLSSKQWQKDLDKKKMKMSPGRRKIQQPLRIVLETTRLSSCITEDPSNSCSDPTLLFHRVYYCCTAAQLPPAHLTRGRTSPAYLPGSKDVYNLCWKGLGRLLALPPTFCTPKILTQIDTAPKKKPNRRLFAASSQSTDQSCLATLAEEQLEQTPPPEELFHFRPCNPTAQHAGQERAFKGTPQTPTWPSAPSTPRTLHRREHKHPTKPKSQPFKDTSAHSYKTNSSAAPRLRCATCSTEGFRLSVGVYNRPDL